MLSKNNSDIVEGDLEWYHKPDEDVGVRKVFSFEKVRRGDGTCWRRQISWKMEEKIKYIAFVYYQFESFSEKDSHRFWNFFIQMSNFIKTKNSNQCRIYHKRIIKKYKTVKYLISIIQQEVPDLSWILSIYTDQLLQNLIEKSKEEKIENNNVEVSKNYQIGNVNYNSQFIPLKPMHDFLKSDIVYQNPENDRKICNLEEKQFTYLPTDISVKQKHIYNQNQRASFKTHNFSVDSLFSYPKQSSQFKLYKQSNILAKGSIGQMDVDNKMSQRDRKWIQCYELYLNWTSKLQELMGSQS